MSRACHAPLPPSAVGFTPYVTRGTDPWEMLLQAANTGRTLTCLTTWRHCSGHVHPPASQKIGAGTGVEIGFLA